MNINSLLAYYSRHSQESAEYLIRHDMVTFLGTDLHKSVELEALKNAMNLPYYKMAMESKKILNNSFLQENQANL